MFRRANSSFLAGAHVKKYDGCPETSRTS